MPTKPKSRSRAVGGSRLDRLEVEVDELKDSIRNISETMDLVVNFPARNWKKLAAGLVLFVWIAQQLPPAEQMLTSAVSFAIKTHTQPVQ